MASIRPAARTFWTSGRMAVMSRIHRKNWTATRATGSTSNAIASSSGSIASGGTTDPVMMISPLRSRSPKAASTVRDVAHDVDPFAGIGLRIAGARELACAPNNAASEAVRCAACARRTGAGEHHVALIDVAAENALGILRWRGEIDDLDRRRDAGDRGLGGRMVGAGGNVAADVHGDFRLGDGLYPARKRYARSRLNAGSARQESHQRPGDVEVLEHRRRGEADLPAQRRVAGVETLAPQRELRPHAARNARVVPQIHDPISIIWAKRSAETSMIVRSHFVAGSLDRAGTHPAPHQHDIRVRRVVEAVPALAR